MNRRRAYLPGRHSLRAKEGDKGGDCGKVESEVNSQWFEVWSLTTRVNWTLNCYVSKFWGQVTISGQSKEWWGLGRGQVKLDTLCSWFPVNRIKHNWNEGKLVSLSNIEPFPYVAKKWPSYDARVLLFSSLDAFAQLNPFYCSTSTDSLLTGASSKSKNLTKSSCECKTW